MNFMTLVTAGFNVSFQLVPTEQGIQWQRQIGHGDQGKSPCDSPLRGAGIKYGMDCCNDAGNLQAGQQNPQQCDVPNRKTE